MSWFTSKDVLQWIIAAALVAGGVTILFYSPIGTSANAQMRSSDTPATTECP